MQGGKPRSGGRVRLHLVLPSAAPSAVTGSGNVLLSERANPVAQLGGALEFLALDGAAELALQLIKFGERAVLLDLGRQFAQGGEGPLALELKGVVV
jgi:hypothetical protein